VLQCVAVMDLGVQTKERKKETTTQRSNIHICMTQYVKTKKAFSDHTLCNVYRDCTLSAQKSPIFPPKCHVFPQLPTHYTMHTETAHSPLKRALYFRKSALYFRKSAMYFRSCPHIIQCIQRLHVVHSKEPYNSAINLLISAKHICMMQYIAVYFRKKSRRFPPKCHIFPQLPTYYTMHTETARCALKRAIYFRYRAPYFRKTALRKHIHVFTLCAYTNIQSSHGN